MDYSVENKKPLPIHWPVASSNLREEGTDFRPKNRFFFIVLNYCIALSLPKNQLLMS